MSRQRPLPIVALLTAILMTIAYQAPVGAGQSVIVDPDPIFESPRVLNGRVYSIVEAGDRIVVAGTFTSIRDWNSSTAMARSFIFAFHPATGLIDQSFAPVFDREVNALATSPDNQWLYAGGHFTTVNGTAQKGLAKISLATGLRDPVFAATANKDVNDIGLTANGLVVGGAFTKIRSVPRSLLAMLDPVTGAALPALDLPVTQSRSSFGAYIQELDVSPDGQRLAIVGNFVRVAGLQREQMAMIDLTTSPASVADWATTRLHVDCSLSFENTYMRDVVFSPDSSFLVAVTTGAFRAHTLCDASHRWETYQTGTHVDPTWVTYTGGDTHWHATITDAAVYVGGHMRWENNPTPSPGGDNDGPGAVRREGIAALDPLSGAPLSFNPGRGRGRGVEAFLATDDYLYVGSDTAPFGGVLRPRLAVLPVAGGTPNPAPDHLALPVTVYAARTDGSLYRSTFDGASLGAAVAVSGPGVDGNNWSALRDGFIQAGRFVYFGTAGAYYQRPFDGTTFGPVTNLSTSVGYVDTDYNLTPYDQPYNVDTTRAAAYAGGRIFYTRTNDTRLFWRWYSLESGIVGAQEHLASPANWSGATGLEVAGDWVYASWNDNKLYRAYLSGQTVSADRQAVDDGASSGTPWAQVRALAFTQAQGAATEPAPPAPPTPLVCPAGQWHATYFMGTQRLGTPQAERCEASVNYLYGSGAPAGTGLAPDQFSALWTTSFTAATAGNYSFSATTDDGVVVSVDDVPVITNWRVQSATTVTATVPLAAGVHEVRVEYFENTSSATARVSYARLP